MKSWYETFALNPGQSQGKLTLVTKSEQFEAILTEVKVPESCDRDWIGTKGSLDRDGFLITDIPLEKKFAKSVMCPDGSTLIYNHKNKLLETSQITCEAHAGFHFSAMNKDGSTTNITGEFEAELRKTGNVLTTTGIVQAAENYPVISLQN
ncbi:hypothetical protein PENTCL1PPCAC_9251 [Pristionchus entomophagus]|uniref:Uncharacterized protein n=1 Tax=Pristionchus entomophagus TaxID=358040 RepID=A0AAV5SV75_9BILA|nr:hypothetical protein PENTCL1PPCAC_9251 [Pristionchus entomophagus]